MQLPPRELPSTSATDATTEQEAALAEADDGAARSFALAMAKLAWETKAGDVLLLHVAPLVYWTRYMLVVSVFSRPQLGAVLGRLQAEAAETFGRTLPGDATGSSSWELMDYGDVCIHIMTPEQRDYDLEGFYAAAEEVDLPFVDGDQGPPPGKPAAAGWRTKM